MKQTILTIICCCALTLTSCNKWLDVKPYDKISEEELLKSEQGFQKLLNGIYIDLNDENLYGNTLMTEMIEVMGGAYAIGSDAITWGEYVDLKNYNYGTPYWRGRNDKVWNKAYGLIINCNKILDNMESKKSLFTGDNYNIIRGEALALRAMLHFDMLRLYGPVYKNNPDAISIPYYTKQSLTVGELLPASKAMELVITDLKAAEVALKNDPIINQGTMMSGDPGASANFLRYRALRLNYYAVQGLLARVSLYGELREQAYDYATKVMAASNVFPFVDKKLVDGAPADPDRIFSSEILFGLSNPNRSLLFKNLYDPSRAPKAVFTIDNEMLLDRIYGRLSDGGSKNDYRYTVNWKSTANASYFYKYMDMVAATSIQNTMVPMLRMGEMYLIATESKSTKLTDGLDHINTLRSHRGITDNLTTLNARMMRYEYIRELYGEGQLFFWYKRNYASIVYSLDLSIPASDKVFVVPMPDTEMNNRQ